MRTIRATWLTVVASLVAVPAQAWWGDGHGILTEAAVLALPEEMPAFFAKAATFPAIRSSIQICLRIAALLC